MKHCKKISVMNKLPKLGACEGVYFLVKLRLQGINQTFQNKFQPFKR